MVTIHMLQPQILSRICANVIPYRMNTCKTETRMLTPELAVLESLPQAPGSLARYAHPQHHSSCSSTATHPPCWQRSCRPRHHCTTAYIVTLETHVAFYLMLVATASCRNKPDMFLHDETIIPNPNQSEGFIVWTGAGFLK